MFIFFFKQKTAYEMRISDWSSDVCSSDLRIAEGRPVAGDQHVAGDGDGHAARPGRAVDHRDAGLAEPVLNVVQAEVEPLDESLPLDAGLAAHDVEAEPGADHLVRAAADYRAHRVVLARRGEQIGNASGRGKGC